MTPIKRTVITGVGIVSPLGASVSDYWERLLKGHVGIKLLTRFDPNRFFSRLAAEIEDSFVNIKDGPYSHEINRMDRFVRFAVSAADDALCDSGIESAVGNLSDGSLFIGVGMGGLPNIENGVIRQEEKGPRRTSPYLIPSLIPNMAASMIALRLNIKGPQYTIAGSCASGIQAIGQAMQNIRGGQCKWALTGGTESLITPITFSGFEAMRALSRDINPDSTPRPFDRERDGMIVGEGAAIFVIEEADFAEARGAKIYGEIAGYATCSGSSGLTLQSADDMIKCMKLALLDARIQAPDIDCIYAQASGMQKGDQCELHSLQVLFGEQSMQPAITSIKGHLGHSFAASGPLNLAAALNSLRRQLVPPTLKLDIVEPGYSNLDIIRKPRTQRIDHCLVNSFGFGGINASLTLSKYPTHRTTAV